jgi:hypothetical protein
MEIDVTKIVPWDLVLVIGGEKLATKCPNFATLLDMGKLETECPQAADAYARMTDVRNLLKRFASESQHAVIEGASDDDALAAYNACAAFWGDYLKKKREATMQQATGRTPEKIAGETPAPRAKSGN